MNKKVHDTFKFENLYFEPLPKVSEQHTAKIENSYKNSYLSSQIQKEIHSTHQKAQTNYKTNIDEQNLYSYISRYCKNQSCYSTENCTTCFMKHFNFCLIKVDNSIIYKWQDNTIFIIAEDLIKALKEILMRPTEQDEILSIFSLHRSLQQKMAIPLYNGSVVKTEI